jgi:hypothetical protein
VISFRIRRAAIAIGHSMDYMTTMQIVSRIVLYWCVLTSLFEGADAGIEFEFPIASFGALESNSSIAGYRGDQRARLNLLFHGE